LLSKTWSSCPSPNCGCSFRCHFQVGLLAFYLLEVEDAHFVYSVLGFHFFHNPQTQTRTCPPLLWHQLCAENGALLLDVTRSVIIECGLD